MTSQSEQHKGHKGAGEPISAESFADRAREHLESRRFEEVGDHKFNPEIPQAFKSLHYKPAAVLIPVVRRSPGATLLFTQRTDHLPDHAGQIAFPGGKIDPEDESVETAALREAEEEIGLQRHDTEIVARAPDYLAGSGYRITPILGLVPEDYPFAVNQNEVDHIFEVPLAYLMNSENYSVGRRHFKGALRRYYSITYDGYRIWGITAGIVRTLYERLYGEDL